MKNSLEGFCRRLDSAEKRTSKLEDRSLEIIDLEAQKQKQMKKNEKSPRDLWYIIKRANIRITRIPKGKGGREFI